ncbi:MAG TPA: C2 family cysteine protease [Candidatus Obscuribacterales bacterium]
MLDNQPDSPEPTEAALAKNPEQAAVAELRAVPSNEQRRLVENERQRMSDTTRDFLPAVIFVDGANHLLAGKDPKVAADADKRKREQQIMRPIENTSAAGALNHNNLCPPTTADSNLRSGNLSALFARNASRLDRDGDGFVSSSEIDRAVTDPNFTGQDAQLVAALHQHHEELEELSDDEWGDENDGVTVNDISQFDAQLAQVNQAGHMWTVGLQSFDQIDVNRDGHMSASELDTAAQNPAATGDFRLTVRQMRERISDIEEASNDELGDENDGITRADLQAYYEEALSNSPSELITDIDSTLYRSGEAMRIGCRSLYATANPLDSIVPDAIRQGRIGDCYFLAAAASMASDPIGRQQIYNMIRDNGNGTYTVTFPGAPDEPITVSAPTDSELALFAQGNKMGTWPAILERAYGRYCQLHPERRSPLNPDGGTAPSEGADGGSWTHDGIRILTGRGVDIDVNQLTTEDQLAANLQAALAEHRPVTCSTGPEVGDDLGVTDRQGLPGQHEYSVIGFDPGTRLVTVRNPWGYREPQGPYGGPRDGQDDGVFVMTLSEYRRAFVETAYAERA